MEWRVPLADLSYDEAEKEAVLAVLDSGWLTMGAVTEEFEARFAGQIGANYAIAVANATVALHLACLALDIGPGDEVIVPSLSFVATANAVLYTGAEVRFADIIGPQDLTISPAAIEKLITKHTKAIMVMHYAGFPCQMGEIINLAKQYSLAVIEDSAHAPGATLNGKALGTWGDVSCFSFFSNKNLSTGEGGMLVTNREDIAEKARLLRSHGMTSLTWDRHQGHAYTYDVVGLGYNYRIDEIRSALGLVQLEKLQSNNQRREAISQGYWRAFSDSSLGLPFQTSHAEPNIAAAYHIFPALLPEGLDRQRFIDELRSAGVQTSIHYPPIHLFSYYQQRYPGIPLPQTEQAAGREITLPLFPSMTPEQVQWVIDAVLRTLA